MSKVNQTKEDKYRASLKTWGSEIDNRPFIRVREDKKQDLIDYNRKSERILAEKSRISKLSGIPIDQINLFDNWGSAE